ncbi:MAG: lipopolysaccharide heptosyltransferase II [Candidatus Omnitrophota bacterium]
MNILQVLPELKSGGVETGVVDLNKELVKKNHKSVVISAGGTLVEKIVKAGGIHYELQVDRKNPLTILGMVGKICDVIKKEDIDIIHARSRAPAFSSFLASYRENVPFITTCHGYYSNHLLSRVMGWGKFVIVASHVIAKHMIEDFGVPRERIRLIPRGVDLEKFEYTPLSSRKEHAGFTIGVIARITPLKGHKHFIRAMSKVVRTIPNAKALIIGEAPAKKEKYKLELEALVKRLSLSKNIIFLGKRDDIPQLLKTFDLLVLPTTTPEAFGRTIIEAQATGVPVIATKVGGVVDIIRHEKSGLLVAPCDWSAMSEAIIRIFKDAKLAQGLTEQARQDVEKEFNLEKMFNRTIGVYEEAKNKISILIIKISAIGDVVLSIPSLSALRKHFNKAKIVMVVGAKARKIVSNCPYVDELVIFDDAHQKGKLKKVLDIATGLRREHFDMVIDLQNNRTSRLLGFLSMAPRRIGFKNKRLDFLLTDKADGAKLKVSPVEHQFVLLRSLGIQSAPGGLELFPSESEQQKIDKVLQNEWVGEKQILIGINIGSSVNWHTKRWDTDNFIKLCRKFSQEGVRVVITGSDDDTRIAEKVISLTETKPINMVARTTLMELASLIKRCNLFISGDSAPLHIACAVSTPCIGLFGPTDSNRHLVPSGSVVSIQKQLPCSPCYRRMCKNAKCMQMISVDEVFEAAMKMLKLK